MTKVRAKPAKSYLLPPIFDWRLGTSFLNAVTLIFLALVTCGSVQAADISPSSDLTLQNQFPDKQPQKNTLIVGSEQDYPPFAIGMTDCTASGFTVDLWKAVAAEAGLNYTIRVRPFRQTLQEFKEGKIDVLINLARSDERNQFADFTVPHVVVHGAIFVRKDNTKIHSENDLAGKSIIVLNADLAHDYAVSKGWGKQLVLVDTAAEGLRLLSAGKYDAMLLSKLSGMQSLQDLGLTNIEPLQAKAGFSQKFAFAVPKGQSELLSKINEALALTKSNGTYNALYDKWFGFYEVKESSLHDLLNFIMPVVGAFLAIGAYFFYRRQIERKEAEKKYRDLYDNAPDMFLSIDAKTATIIDCNQTLLATMGYSRKELIGRPALALYHPDYAEIAQASFQALLAGNETHGVELQILRKDGSKVDVSLSASAVCDKYGAILYSRSSMHDISMRKQAEAATIESRNLLMAIIDTAPIRVFWKDKDLHYLGCNTAFAKDAGMAQPSDVIGKDDYQMAWKAQAELYRIDDVAVMDSGVSKLFYDEPQTTADGQTIWLRTSKVPLRNQHGETIGLLGIYEDITKHRKTEEKLRTLSTAIEQSPISVVITDVDANIEYVNPRFTEVTGYTAEDVIGQNPRILQSGLTSIKSHRAL